MQFITLATLAIATVVYAAVVPELDTRQASNSSAPVECCYLYSSDGQGGGNTQLFRFPASDAMSQQDIGEPNSWCIAKMDRSTTDPNNCAAASTIIWGGYCTYYSTVPNVACS